MAKPRRTPASARRHAPDGGNEQRAAGAFPGPAPGAPRDRPGTRPLAAAQRRQRGGRAGQPGLLRRPGSNARWGRSGGLPQSVRTHLNRFVDTSKSTFEPYPEASGIDRNAARWASASPVGSFVTIDIPGNDGTVATIGAGPDHWTFATVQSPRDGLHPVSGNRQFGYTDNGDGTVTFYTRGVDRITESASAAINWASSAAGGSGAVFDGADALWRSFQQRVAAYVRETGGQAQVLDPVTVRPDWSAVRDVLTGREAVRTFLDRQR